MPKITWPKQSECDAYYGNPRGRDGTMSQSWYQANMTKVIPPFRVTFGGQLVKAVGIHKKCADSLGRIFKATWDKIGRDQAVADRIGISIFSGSYNYRPIRGSNRLSMHAYGCATDWDAARNQLGDKTPFFGFDHPLVVAHLDEGWIWGADWDGDHQISDENRPDGMHFQAARVG